MLLRVTNYEEISRTLTRNKLGDYAVTGHFVVRADASVADYTELMNNVICTYSQEE